ncbi:MAG: hypothetical protein U5L08_07905 [Xanthomonadales bacterium]|nr:hypothetical protein [Xanthomonadales bacterium]
MTWFENLTGVEEDSPEIVREAFELDGEWLTSRVNGRCWRVGRLQTPSLGELRQRVAGLYDRDHAGGLRISERVADVRDLHADPDNAGAMFQAASQFNLLEMMHPEIRPEHGIGGYERDRTQGPACAIACGAGTIYRNYLVEVDGQRGQDRHRQIDCLADVGRVLGNRDNRLWEMRNGYALASEEGLREIADLLAGADEDALDGLRSRLRIGMQWDTEVTLPGAGHTVSQAYCAALPVAYGLPAAELWAPFARLVLEAAYEAVFCAARLNRARTGNDTLFLTMLGGGAFGNRDEWIADAIVRAAGIHAGCGLDVRIVSYGRPQVGVARTMDRVTRASRLAGSGGLMI